MENPEATRPVVVTTVLPESRYDVWTAWTDPAWLRRWFGSDPHGTVLAARADPRVGGNFEVTFRNPGGDVFTCFGTYAAVDKPSHLGFSWRWVAAPDAVEQVDVTLEDVSGGTRLTLVHSNIDAQTTHGYQEGWLSTFEKLRRALDQNESRDLEPRRDAGSLRVSSRERETAVDRLQAAFLEGRLSDVELADRVDRALGARLGADLSGVLADLPAVIPQASLVAGAPAPVKLVTAYKSKAVQAGSWTVPARFKCQVYKSHQLLDLTKAVVTAPVTEIRISAYKSTVEVVVPPGLRVDVRGKGYRSEWVNEAGDGPDTGPLLVVMGSAYKGTVTIKRLG